MIDIDILNKLNAPTKEERIENLKQVLKTTAFPPAVPQYINNHIHTTYSFSPYSPTAAVYAARMEGLCTAGIIDHDSISGAEEFIEAAPLGEQYRSVLKEGFENRWIDVGLVSEQNVTHFDSVANLLLPSADDTAFHCNARLGHNYCICHGLSSLCFVIAC